MKLYVGVKALIVKEGKILLLREARYDEGTNEGKWDVPGGRIETHERLFEALSREVKEETGLVIEPGDICYVQENFPTIKGEECHVVRLHYRATYVSGEVTLSKDHDAYEWVGEAELGDRPCVSGLREELTKYFENQRK